VPELGGNWQLALALVFVSCVLFFALSLSPLRAWLIDAIPMPLKLGIAAGIGLFLALIGLQNAGIIADDKVTLVTLGDLSKPQALLACAGFLVIAALAVRKVPGAIIIGVLAVTLIAAGLGLEPWHGVAAAPPSLAPTFLKLDLAGAAHLSLIVIVLTLLLVTILDTAGTLIGLRARPGFSTRTECCRGSAKPCSPTRVPAFSARCSALRPPPPILRARQALRRAAAPG